MAITWILFTLMAAFMQAWRNAFQKQLSTTVDVWGVTLARFIFALPFAVIYLSSLYHFSPVTETVTFTTKYWIYIRRVRSLPLLWLNPPWIRGAGARAPHFPGWEFRDDGCPDSFPDVARMPPRWRGCDGG